MTATCPFANIQCWRTIHEKDSPSCIVWPQMCHVSSSNIFMGIDLGLGHGTNIVVNVITSLSTNHQQPIPRHMYGHLMLIRVRGW
jgi:hypothetical protein